MEKGEAASEKEKEEEQEETPLEVGHLLAADQKRYGGAGGTWESPEAKE